MKKENAFALKSLGLVATAKQVAAQALARVDGAIMAGLAPQPALVPVRAYAPRAPR